MSDGFKGISNPTGRHLTVLALRAYIHSVQKTFLSSHWKMEGHLRALMCLYGARALLCNVFQM